MNLFLQSASIFIPLSILALLPSHGMKGSHSRKKSKTTTTEPTIPITAHLQRQSTKENLLPHGKPPIQSSGTKSTWTNSQQTGYRPKTIFQKETTFDFSSSNSSPNFILHDFEIFPNLDPLKHIPLKSPDQETQFIARSKMPSREQWTPITPIEIYSTMNHPEKTLVPLSKSSPTSSENMDDILEEAEKKSSPITLEKEDEILKEVEKLCETSSSQERSHKDGFRTNLFKEYFQHLGNSIFDLRLFETHNESFQDIKSNSENVLFRSTVSEIDKASFVSAASDDFQGTLQSLNQIIIPDCSSFEDRKSSNFEEELQAEEAPEKPLETLSGKNSDVVTLHPSTVGRLIFKTNKAIEALPFGLKDVEKKLKPDFQKVLKNLLEKILKKI